MGMFGVVCGWYNVIGAVEVLFAVNLFCIG